MFKKIWYFYEILTIEPQFKRQTWYHRNHRYLHMWRYDIFTCEDIVSFLSICYHSLYHWLLYNNIRYFYHCSKWFWDASPPNGYSCLCIVTQVCDLQYLAIRDFASFKKREYLTPYFRDSGKRNFYIRDPWSSRFLFLNRARDSPIRLSSLVGYQLHPLSLLRA